MEMDGTDAAGPTRAEESEERIRDLGEQFGRFRRAVRRLIAAHLDLARAEFGEIAAEVKRFAGLVGLALGFVFFALLLVAVGLPLFLGDWLFGSLGWGLAHGVLIAAALAIAAVGAALGATGRSVWLPFLSGVAVAVAVILALGTNIAADALSQLVARAEPALRIDVPSGWDTLVAGLIVGGATGAVLFFAAALLLRRPLRRALGLLVDGLIVGALAGAIFGGARYGWQVGSAIGVTTGLLVWIAAMVGNITRLDISARFERMRPSTTIETARETLEWVRARTKLVPR
jgi:hypothetical protein